MCKDVGGYLTKCRRIAASITLNDESLLTQSVSQSLINVGIELLGELKIKSLPHQVSKQSAKSRAKDIFDSLDKDGDGELTMKEFVDGYLVMMVDA